jgi:hypothetical protein
VQEDTRQQLIALRQQLDDVIGTGTTSPDLASLLRVADGLTKVLLGEIARARAGQEPPEVGQ